MFVHCVSGNREKIPYQHVYDSKGRRFYSINGWSFPSVTTVLDSIGKENLEAWEANVGPAEAERIRRSCAAKGTQLHDYCDKYLQNCLVEIDASNPIIEKNFNEVKGILQTYVDTVYMTEFQLYSVKLGLAGTCDGWVWLKGYGPGIIDFKFKLKHQKLEWITKHMIQCTAYAEMVEERYNETIEYVATIIMNEECKPQIFIDTKYKYIDTLKMIINKFNEERNLS